MNIIKKNEKYSNNIEKILCDKNYLYLILKKMKYNEICTIECNLIKKNIIKVLSKISHQYELNIMCVMNFGNMHNGQLLFKQHTNIKIILTNYSCESHNVKEMKQLKKSNMLNIKKTYKKEFTITYKIKNDFEIEECDYN